MGSPDVCDARDGTRRIPTEGKGDPRMKKRIDGARIDQLRVSVLDCGAARRFEACSAVLSVLDVTMRPVRTFLIPRRSLVFGLILFVSVVISGDAAESAVSGPRIVGQLIDPIALRGVEDVHLEGGLAYLPCREGRRLTICSIADPANPRVVSSFIHERLGPAAGFAMHDEIVFLTSQGNQELLAVDVSNPAEPQLLGSVVVGARGNGSLYKAAYQGGHCYVAQQSEKRLYVVDVRDPAKLKVVASVVVTEENDGPFSVTLRDNHAWVGTIFGRRNRLVAVDIGNPSAPRIVGRVLGPDIGHASGEFVGDRFFAVNWDRNAFLVFEVRDVAHPRLAAKLVDSRLGKPNRCVLAGDRAYLPMVEGDGVAVVDVADPLKPRFVTAFRDPSLKKTYGVAVRGNLLFVGAREGNSLTVLDRASLED